MTRNDLPVIPKALDPLEHVLRVAVVFVWVIICAGLATAGSNSAIVRIGGEP